MSKEWWSEYGVSISASGGYLDVPRLLNTSDVGDEINGDRDLGSPTRGARPLHLVRELVGSPIYLVRTACYKAIC